MAASKRSNYSANNSRSAGTEAARNLGVVLGLGGLSFFLGFFVLSRMVPDKRDETGLAPAAAATSHKAPAIPAQTPPPAPEPNRSEAATVAAAATPRHDSTGPIVERDTEPTTQAAGSLERPARPSTPDTTRSADFADNASTTADTNPAAGMNAAGANAAARTDSATGRTSETDSAPATTPRTRRRPRPSSSDTSATSSDKTDNGGFSQDDQKPSRIDRDTSSGTSEKSARRDDTSSATSRSDRADSTGDEPSRPAKTVKRIRYSVRGSAYSRREAAEREVRRITDVGLDATVVPVTTEDGTTVYRVQQGVYRNRSNAEKAKTKLSDAGVEAEIVRSREKE